MKASLALQQTPRLAMTPQLRQALGLLQMSALELRDAVHAALESNLLLERGEDNEPTWENDAEALPAAGAEALPATKPEKLADADWDSAEPQVGWQEPGDAAFPEPAEALPDLRSHLRGQLALSHLGPRDAAMAALIIDSLNEDGYLAGSLEELRLSLADGEAAPEPEEIEAVLHHIQSFDPPGVAARDLRECLSIQLRQADPQTPGRDLALKLVHEHLEEIADHATAKLCQRLMVIPAQLHQALALIQSLNPRPGAALGFGAVDYIVPDVLVTRRDGAWFAEINPATVPRLRVNALYAQTLDRRRREQHGDLGRQLQEARWLVKSLRMRNETLLRVAECIVRHQTAFLDHGEEAMRPLMLKEVAAELGVHESTISRVVANKYLSTPRGPFAMRHFFSNELSQHEGGTLSSTAVRAHIRKLVAQEDPGAPLSDDRITRELVNRGIRVARRTVAKYREAMTIPPAHERKRLATRRTHENEE